MSPQPAPKSAPESLGQTLAQVQALLEKQKLVETLVHRQGGPRYEPVENDMVTVRADVSLEVAMRYLRRLVLKELGVAALNGLLWGGLVGLPAYALYGNPGLGGVMMPAMFLNLVVAAFAGIAIPFTLQKLKRDPALGSSVLLTATTDSMGFFIFLGLATLLLTH